MGDEIRMSKGGFVIFIVIVSTLAVGSFLAYTGGHLNFILPANMQVAPPGEEGPDGPVDIEGETLAYMKTWVVAEDDVSDDLESEDIFIWYDWNGDGVMQRSAFAGFTTEDGLLGGEIETTSSGATDGYFQTRNQYPVGKAINVFVDPGADGGYQKTYATLTMYGTADTSNVITTNDIVCRKTDDAVTFSGLISRTSIDDGTDYNYTLSGSTGEFEVAATFATSDAGVNSQTENSPTYDGTGKWTHWGSGKEYAATFIGGYCSNQDAADLGISSGDFDFYYQGASNTFFATFLDDFDADAKLFYDSDDDSAPTWTFGFDVDINAAGALTYIGFFQDVEWSDFTRGVWGPTTDATIVGTPGADWDWVA